MQSCHSYPVLLTVKNTGTLNWSSKNGVVLIAASSNGFTFDPSKYPVPEGVVVHPGESYTFPVTINVPCPMQNGTYLLRFMLAYTIKTKTGPVEIRFGDKLTDNVIVGTPVETVGSSEVKMGVKAFAPATTVSGISTGFAPRQYTTTFSSPVVNRSAITPLSGSHVGTGRDLLKQYTPVNARVIRNFNAVTGLLWIGLIQAE
jgi:hypothetical protein